MFSHFICRYLTEKKYAYITKLKTNQFAVNFPKANKASVLNITIYVDIKKK